MGGQPLSLRDVDAAVVPPNPEATLSAYGRAVLGTLAAVTAVDGVVLEDEYRWYLETGAKLLTPQWQQIPVQVLALSTFLDPPPLDQALKDLEASVAKGRVSAELRGELVEAVLDLLEVAPQAGIRRGEVAERLVQAVVDDSPERLGRARVMQRADRAYEDIGRSGATKGLFSRVFGRGEKSSWIEPRVAEINARCRHSCGRVAWLGDTLGKHELVDAAQRVETLLQEQPYRIALVGEFKHGKSSLFNAIAGERLSPVGETRPTTAVVVELCDAEQPSYTGRWLEEEQLSLFRKYLQDHHDNVYADEVRSALESACGQPWFEPGEEIPTCPTLEELAPFLATTGEYAIAVERVMISLPVATLRSGAVLVDTPGLNDPSRVRELISIEEARSADCVVFVLNGTKLGSESERRALSEILRAGRALHIVPVVTHLDLLSDQEARVSAIEEAEKLVGACAPPDDGAIKVLPALGVDAADAERRSLARSGSEAPAASELGRLQAALRQAMRDPGRTVRYEARLSAAVDELRRQSLESAAGWLEEHKARLPTREQLIAQEELADRLLETGEHYRRHVGRQLASVRERLESEGEELHKAIVAIQKDVLAAARPAIEAEILKLGAGVMKRQSWKELDERLQREVVEPRLERFRAAQDQRLENWTSELSAFEDTVRSEVEDALDELRVSLDEVGSLALEQDRILGMALAAREVLDTLTRHLGSGALGALLTGGGLRLATGIQIAARLVPLTSWTIAAGALGGTLAVGLKLMDKEAARKRFLESKLKGIERGLARHLEAILPQEHRAVEEVWERFLEVAHTYYGPVIAGAFSVAEKVHLQRRIWDKIRQDGEQLVSALTRGELGIDS